MICSNLSVNILVPTQWRSEEGCIDKAILLITILPLSGVSDSQHSSVGVTTGSEGHLNLKDETAPEVNGNEVDGQNSSDSSETGSMNVGNKNDSGILTCIRFLKYPNK